MADEESNDAAEEAGKEGKPWLALSLMLLVVPVVTLAITEFVVIPRLQSSVAGDSGAASKGGGAGGDHGGGDHGGGGNKAGSAELGGSGTSYEFEEMVANLAGTMGTRFIKISFEVRGESPDVAQAIRVNKPVVTDAIITALSSESIQSLEVPGGRNRLRLSLIESINQALSTDLVEELYFTEFMIQ